MVRMPYVVHLETKGMLQVVARLLTVEACHRNRTVNDVHNHQRAGFGQAVSGFTKLIVSRHLV